MIAVGCRSPESMAGMGHSFHSILLQSEEGAIQQQREIFHHGLIQHQLSATTRGINDQGAMIRPTPPLAHRQPMVMEPSSASSVRLFRVEAPLTQAACWLACITAARSQSTLTSTATAKGPVTDPPWFLHLRHTRGRAEAVVNASRLVRGGNRDHEPARFVETEPGELSRLQVQHHPSPC